MKYIKFFRYIKGRFNYLPLFRFILRDSGISKDDFATTDFRSHTFVLQTTWFTDFNLTPAIALSLRIHEALLNILPLYDGYISTGS